MRRSPGLLVALLSLYIFLSVTYFSQEPFQSPSPSHYQKSPPAFTPALELIATDKELQQFYPTPIAPTPTVPAPITPAAAVPPPHTSPPQHTVYMGDSLTRYRFLQHAWSLHFPASSLAPRDVISDTHRDWAKFFKHTSSPAGVFGPDAMKCDCYRGGVAGEATENRYYEHDGITLTYLQFLKDGLEGRGWYSAADASKSQISTRATSKRPHAWETNLTQTLRLHVGNLSPRPTTIMMNCGLWNKAEHIAESIAEWMPAAKAAVGDHGRVLWIRTSPHLMEVTQGYQWSGKTTDHAADRYCAKNPDVCTVVPFGEDLFKTLKKEDYLDKMHFKKAVIYQRWIDYIASFVEGLPSK